MYVNGGTCQVHVCVTVEVEEGMAWLGPSVIIILLCLPCGAIINQLLQDRSLTTYT